VRDCGGARRMRGRESMGVCAVVVCGYVGVGWWLLFFAIKLPVWYIRLFFSYRGFGGKGTPCYEMLDRPSSPHTHTHTHAHTHLALLL
jgi:hypothetical protein